MQCGKKCENCKNTMQ